MLPLDQFDMSDTNGNTVHKQRRSEAFFGRRKSKSLSSRQQKLFDIHLPKLKLSTDATTPTSLASCFPVTTQSIVLEIGFGGGEHLIHQSKSYPLIGHIGVEPFVNSMAKALTAIQENQIQNMRLFDDDATLLLDWLPEGQIDRVDLLYPDPWPKTRHWKRRFVNQKNLDRIARVLAPDGQFRFASDIESYINWTLNHCYQHSAFQWIASNKRDWENPYPNWIRTRYEAKAIREGRTPCYLTFVRN